MDLTKLIDLIAEVAVRRTTQRETKDNADSGAVRVTLWCLRCFTRFHRPIYRYDILTSFY